MASETELVKEASADLNSGKGRDNLYMRELGLVLQLDVTYALALTRHSSHLEAARRVLAETERFAGKMVHPSVSLRFQTGGVKANLLKELFL